MTDLDPKRKPFNGRILAINLSVFGAYTIICMLIGNEVIMLGLGIAVAHFVICLAMAFAERSVVWGLAGLLILLIGMGTCVGAYVIAYNSHR